MVQCWCRCCKLAAHLAAAVFKQSGVQLDTLFSQLPSRLHVAVLSTLIPEVVTDGLLWTDTSCTVWTKSIGASVCKESTPALQALLEKAATFTKLSTVHLGIGVSTGVIANCSQADADSDAVTEPEVQQCATHELAEFLRETLSSLLSLKTLHVGGVFREACMLSASASVHPQLPLLEEFGVAKGQLGSSPELVKAVSQCRALRKLSVWSASDEEEQIPMHGAQDHMSSLANLTSLVCFPRRMPV